MAHLVTRFLLPVLLLACLLQSGCAADPQATGADLYVRYCAECHGPGLEGASSVAIGPDTPAADLTDQELATIIVEGDDEAEEEPMPGIALDSELVAKIIAHVRTVQGPRG